MTHSLFRTLRLAVWGVSIIRVPFPQFDVQIGVFPALMQPAYVLSGLAMLLIGFTLCSYVHHYMATDWRSGVDERAETNLITSGPSRGCATRCLSGWSSRSSAFSSRCPRSSRSSA